MRTASILMLLIVFSWSSGFAQSQKNTDRLAGDKLHGDKESVLAILYQQRAAEYTALCLQAYNLAKLKVNAALANPVITRGDLPLAVITDLDETALDNSANEAHQYLSDSVFDPGEFNRWIRSEQADTVPGSPEFINYVDSLSTHGPKKIDIYYISNRDTSMVSYTLDNMKKLGFPQCDPTHFKFKSTTSSKESRRQEVLRDHQIVVLIGDNLESDVFGAKAVGMRTILTLTGVTRRSDLQNLPAEWQPDLVIEDLTELL